MFLRRVDVIVRNDALERRVSTRLLPSVTRFPDGARTAPHAWGPSKRRNATAGRVLVRVLQWPSRSGSGGKNQWGWGDFTTRDLKRRQHMARLTALIYNWWSLLVRLANPVHHREAITSRPLLLHGIARRNQHAGQTRLTVTSSHGRRRMVVAALRRITGFFRSLMRSAEQLSAEDRWRRILAEALK